MAMFLSDWVCPHALWQVVTLEFSLLSLAPNSKSRVLVHVASTSQDADSKTWPFSFGSRTGWVPERCESGYQWWVWEVKHDRSVVGKKVHQGPNNRTASVLCKPSGSDSSSTRCLHCYWSSTHGSRWGPRAPWRFHLSRAEILVSFHTYHTVFRHTATPHHDVVPTRSFPKWIKVNSFSSGNHPESTMKAHAAHIKAHAHNKATNHATCTKPVPLEQLWTIKVRACNLTTLESLGPWWRRWRLSTACSQD